MISLNQKSYNYGFALLKTFMCFIVILYHCWSETDTGFLLLFNILRPYAVPTFMFISFYLMQKSFVELESKYMLKRLEKLIKPQIIWAFIYFGVYWLYGKLHNQSLVYGISDIFWQILTGHSPQLNPSMWFQSNLIVITILFFVIFYVLNEKCGVVFIILLSLICYFMQYSGINYQLFGSMRYELCYPLGRLFETIPAAVFGFLASKYNLLEPRKGSKMGNIFIGLIMAGVSLKLSTKMFVPSTGFAYSGIWKVVFAFAITMFAYNLNFNIGGERGTKFLEMITKYTLGIYCSHRLVAFFVYNILGDVWWVSDKTFRHCILIYVISFVFCWLLSKVPLKYIKDIV